MTKFNADNKKQAVFNSGYRRLIFISFLFGAIFVSGMLFAKPVLAQCTGTFDHCGSIYDYCDCTIPTCGSRECGLCYGHDMRLCYYTNPNCSQLEDWGACQKGPTESWSTYPGSCLNECGEGGYNWVECFGGSGDCVGRAQGCNVGELCENASCVPASECGGGGIPPPPPPGSPDFTLAVSSPQSIYSCSSSTFDISIASLNNYSGYVNLFYNACPDAASCTLTPDYLYVSASTNGVVSQFKVASTCDAFPGTSYPITITASGTVYHQSTSTLTISYCFWPKDAACVSMIAPGTVIANKTFSASTTMKNTGSCEWLSTAFSSPYPDKLGSQNPQDNSRWGFGRVDLPVMRVKPNQTTTFNFNALAPLTTGTYPFDWKMLAENLAWYGGTCAASINVVSELSPTGDCDPPPGGDYTITRSCSFPGTVNGVDNGSLTIMPGVTFTVKTGQTIVWNSAKNIIPEGSIVFIGTGRFLKTNLWMVDSDVNGWPANFTQYYGDSTASLSDGINAPAACSSCRRRMYMNSIISTMSGSV
jgi:hypothetical protein